MTETTHHPPPQENDVQTKNGLKRSNIIGAINMKYQVRLYGVWGFGPSPGVSHIHIMFRRNSAEEARIWYWDSTVSTRYGTLAPLLEFLFFFEDWF